MKALKNKLRNILQCIIGRLIIHCIDKHKNITTEATMNTKKQQADALESILSQIKSYNDEYGLMSQEDTNETIMGILEQYGIEDDEDSIENYFSEIPTAIWNIRDAEAGSYKVFIN